MYLHIKEGGHTFLLNGDEVQLKGALISFVGDTPALGRVGGFKESVGPAFRKCRQCMATGSQIQSLVSSDYMHMYAHFIDILTMKFSEEKFTMRNHDAHLWHCEYIERQHISPSEREHYSKVYGINRHSILTMLTHFDVTKQLPQDIMHMLYEGIFVYHITWMLDNISVPLLAINESIMTFPFAYFEVRPTCLSSTKVTGSQTGNFSCIWFLILISAMT